MQVSHNVAAYVKEKFDSEQFRDLTYFMCFEDSSVYPVHFTYSEHPIQEHWKVLAYACDNDLAEQVGDKTLAAIFVSASLRCPPVHLTKEDLTAIQQEAREWAEGEEKEPFEYHKMKDYLIVEGFDGESYETIALELLEDKVGEVLEFDNDGARYHGFLPILRNELVRIWIKAQDNYEELLEKYAKEGRVKLTAEEFETIFPDGVITGSETTEIEETQSEEEQEEVILVEEESDHDN